MSRTLSRRSQQVLDLIYRAGELSAAEILAALPEVPSYSAVRSILRSLEAQGLVRHKAKGLRYVYAPTVTKRKASRTALAEVVEIFFDGSPEPALESLLYISRDRGYDLDFDRLQRMIDAARRSGR